MNIIPLQKLPRQEFSITLDGAFLTIILVAIKNCMYATITRNNVPVISGVRCMPGRQIIPYNYLEGKAGNFAFKTPGGSLPWWENFDNDHVLYYALRSELEAMRS